MSESSAFACQALATGPVVLEGEWLELDLKGKDSRRRAASTESEIVSYFSE